ncbi:sensor histidine kinase [Schlesneria paludicola]|uniref:sensor histidine kinase n=1 Tax=Schlesneria paludicola TaxID=360056 RepID=UPI00029A4731|nr:ATP-binding protein [Schlesneria paludicola]
MNGQLRINRHFIFRIAAPTIIISGLLVALGVIAAWSVQSQHLRSSELIANEVHGIIAAQDLYIDMREIRHLLQQYGRNDDVKHLNEIRSLLQLAVQHIANADQHAHNDEERAQMEKVRTEWSKFTEHLTLFLNEVPQNGGASKESIDRLLQDITNVVEPSNAFLILNRNVVDTTNEANRRTAEQSRQGFLLLGITGGAAGLIAGLLIARGISQSIVQLDISVRGAAGLMSDVVGPVRISRSGGFRELEAGLQEVETHIATIVGRLQQRELEVLHSEQLAAVGQLAAGLAHELRNPLMPMKMLVQGAIERDDGQGLRGEQLLVVEEEISRLEHSIQDFLDFARPPTLEKRPLDVRLVVEQTVELISGRADRQRVQIFDDFPDTPVIVEADAAQLRQVMLNVLLNALDALPDGGRVDVTISNTRSPDWHGSSDTVRTKPWTIISIHDSGKGFASEMLERLFEPFFSTKETGTGLGMSICQRIIEAHGGVISASNSPQGGAIVSLSLPPAN